jgi:hypothetical protein
VIARAPASDVFAAGYSLPPHLLGTSARVQVHLDHSAYADVDTAFDEAGLSATVTGVGEEGNIVAVPLLAADGYHQLPSSPTIDSGAVDGISGLFDIDGQSRMVGTSADIGADEFFGTPTGTTLNCAPSALTVGGPPARCAVTVVESPGTPTGPAGAVSLHSNGPGSFDGEGHCTLTAVGADESRCEATYQPTGANSRTDTLSADYPGDLTRTASQGSTQVAVTVVGKEDGGSRLNPPQTRLTRHPSRKGAQRLVRFAFGSDQPGSSFECKLDRRSYKRCLSPLKMRVKPGAHTFRVRAINQAGVADPTPVVFPWRVMAG